MLVDYAHYRPDELFRERADDPITVTAQSSPA